MACNEAEETLKQQKPVNIAVYGKFQPVLATLHFIVFVVHSHVFHEPEPLRAWKL